MFACIFYCVAADVANLRCVRGLYVALCFVECIALHAYWLHAWAGNGAVAELEPGHGSPGHRVSDFVRVGSRVKVIYLQTQYCDPVSERTTE